MKFKPVVIKLSGSKRAQSEQIINKKINIYEKRININY